MKAASLHPSLAQQRARAASRERVGTVARRPRVLFADHASRLSGAELVLLDILRGWTPGTPVFLFENGPLVDALKAAGAAPVLARHGGDLGAIKRDRSLLRALPKLRHMAGLVIELARAARAHDVVYANSQKSFVLAALATRIARRTLVWHLHDILTPAHFAGAQRRLVIGLANRCAQAVIVPSQAAADAFVAAGGRARLLHLVPNGLDIPPETASRHELRATLGLPVSFKGDGFMFGVFSRLSPWKGQHVAIGALAGLPGARCVIVGDALFGEDAYATELRHLAETTGVADRVAFLGHRTDVPRLMRAMDAVVHPSVDPEPFGRTLVEAMLARVPVIATATGAAPGILDGGLAGILVKPGSAASLAEALVRVRTDPASHAAMIDRAEARALARFSAPQMVAAIDAVLCGLP